jgi:type I restriction enzyme M protein
MIVDTLKGLEEFEAGLWKIADNLRANSNLASNEYFRHRERRPASG